MATAGCWQPSPLPCCEEQPVTRRVLRTRDILGVDMATPEGHRHLRTVLRLEDGEELELQEATVAALVRAYVAIKTDPRRNRVRLRGRELIERKREFAEWQLLEEDAG